MSYLSEKSLKALNFKFLGKNVKISEKAAIYDFENIEIDDNSRIDDFCVISGSVKIGKNVHIAPQCLLAGGELGIIMEDYSGLAYGVKIFTQSDDYSGNYMTNPTIPKRYKQETKKIVIIKKHSIVGTASIVMPGVTLGIGTSIGAMSLVRKSTEDWSIYVGNPAKKIRNRSNNLLKLEERF